jgi:hypothetical protein
MGCRVIVSAKCVTAWVDECHDVSIIVENQLGVSRARCYRVDDYYVREGAMSAGRSQPVRLGPPEARALADVIMTVGAFANVVIAVADDPKRLECLA